MEAALIEDDKDFHSFDVVAGAIERLVACRDEQPDLTALAADAGMSPSHFQRTFKEGVGVSPKRFLQYLAAADARDALHNGEAVLQATLGAGLSSASRLHDLFLVAEAMTPGAYKQKGAGEVIRYAELLGPVGRILMGATDKGVCWLSFVDQENPCSGLRALRGDWPAAEFIEDADFVAPLAQSAFDFVRRRPLGQPLKLHVQGTNFQLKVWEALLRIPAGKLVSYGDVARAIGSPKAVRAVGSAVGANMVSVLIPCHRVIRATGALENYRWGGARKKTLIAMERASCG